MPIFTPEVGSPLYAETMVIAMAPSGISDPPLPTTEERLQKFSAIKNQTDALITKMQSEQTDVNTAKSTVDSEQVKWQQKLAAANATIQKAEQERQSATQGVIPYIEAESNVSDSTVRVAFRDMPTGIKVGFNGEEMYSVPQGAGTMELEIPFSYSQISLTIEVYSPQGTYVSTLIEFRAVQGRVRTGGGFGNDSLEQFKFVPGQAATVTPEQEAAARAAKTEAEKALLSITEQKTALNSETARLTKEMNDLKRTKIPYARMHVTPVNGPNPFFTVRYQTPYLQTFFEVRINGETNPILQKTFDSPGGETDRKVDLAINKAMFGNGNGPVDIYMYEDSTKKNLIEKFGGNFDRNTNKVSGTSEIPWGTVENGRIGEESLKPIIGVVTLKGPNALLFLQSPYNKSIVQIDSGGLFSYRVLDHVDGLTATPVTLTISGDKPSGTYNIKLYACDRCMELDSVPVKWDKTQKTLTLVDPADKVDSLDPKITAAAEVLERETSLKSIDVSGTSVDKIQGVYLYQKSKFYIAGDQVEKLVAAAYPQSFPADINAWALAESQKQNKPASILKDTLLKVQSDLIATARTNLGYYENLMGTVMEKAVDVVVTVKAGGSEATALTNLQTAIDTCSRNRYVQELNPLKITTPTRDAALNEGIRLAGSELEFLLAKQGIIAELREEESYKATTNPPPEPKLISKEAFLGTLKSINAAHWDSAAAKKKAVDNYYMSQSDEYISYYGIRPDQNTDSRSQVALMLGVTPVVARTGEFEDWTQQNFDTYEQELKTLQAEWQKYIDDNAENAVNFAKQALSQDDGTFSLIVGQVASTSTTIAQSDVINSKSFSDAMSIYMKDQASKLVLAKNAKTPEERHQKLIDGKFMEYVPGNGSKPGALTITVNGHFQEIGADISKAGMEVATNTLEAAGYEILHFRVGIFFLPSQYNTNLLYTLSEQVLLDRLKKIGKFANKSSIQKIGLMGYSWGGGTVVNFANKLETTEFKALPVHMAVLDAVQLGLSKLAQPVTIRPPVESVFNRWQEHNEITANAYIKAGLTPQPYDTFSIAMYDGYQIFTQGQPARGNYLTGNKVSVDNQFNLGVSANHYSIDDPLEFTNAGIKSRPTQDAINFIINQLK